MATSEHQDMDPGTHCRAGIARFICALMNGGLGNVKFQPALTREVHDLYAFWCFRAGERIASLWFLKTVLAREHRIFKSRRRFLENGATSNPQMFFMFTRKEPGVVEQAWLGRCVEEFRDASKEYRATHPVRPGHDLHSPGLRRLDARSPQGREELRP